MGTKLLKVAFWYVLSICTMQFLLPSENEVSRFGADWHFYRSQVLVESGLLFRETFISLEFVSQDYWQVLITSFNNAFDLRCMCARVEFSYHECWSKTCINQLQSAFQDCTVSQSCQSNSIVQVNLWCCVCLIVWLIVRVNHFIGRCKTK